MPIDIRRFPLLRVLIAPLAAGLIVSCGGSGNEEPGPRVTVEQGTVEGIQAESDMQAFRGIRYAPAPEGDMRWRPPGEPPSFGDEVYMANSFGNACPQNGGAFGETSREEDCLFLNVYTPDKDGGPYAVMVWIHGGAFIVGSGGSSYLPSRLVAEDLVVVTLNYRLGALGFLPHHSLRDADGDSGNYGLMDQQAALRWVQQNIAAFGGDPNNVTIFGESAGGHSVLSHVASPEAEDLFLRAISQSGSYNGAQIPQTVAETIVGDPYVAAAGCDSAADVAACLRGLSTDEIMTAQGDSWYQPVSGTDLLPESVQTDLTDADPEVPIMMGSNLHEGRLFVALDIADGTLLMDEASYDAAVDTLLAADPRSLDTVQIADDYLAQFSGDSGMALYHKAYAKIQTDWRFACSGLGQLQGLANGGNAVYAYWFTDDDAPSPLEAAAAAGQFDLGAAHSLEIQYLFDSLLSRSPTADQLALSETMVDYWANFAKYGQPISGTSAATAWPTFTATGEMLELDQGGLATVPDTDFATYHDCSYWASPPTQSAM